ncbi:MAG TPA: nucleoside-diphosphate kinase, partial [archaeon]|nr:nucleoside-diphosphate kinase [archaeon]
MKTKASAEKRGEKFTKDPREHGMGVVKRLRKHMTECPVVAMVLEGPHAIEIVRKMVGSTEPRSAEMGTIRGDYTSDSYALGDDVKGRSIRNIVHASDKENAAREVSLWFASSELFKYEHPLQKILYD